jgi:phenylacetate-CoA oxygenase PaaJ subunit
VSIVELGIVRDVARASDAWIVTVTPTYSGCPATRIIEADIRTAIGAVIGEDVRIVTALAPAWTTDWIAPEGRLKLREAGIAPPHAATLGAVQGAPGDVPAPARARALPELWLVADDGARALRVYGLQGAIPVHRVPRAVRLLQAALTSRAL